MTVITRKAEYAVISMVELASLEEGESTTTKKIAETQEIPLNLVVQILAELNKAGWTNSHRGPSGGVSLAIDPSSITLKDVIELFDGPVTITRCLMQDAPCKNRKSCGLRNIWKQAQQNMLETLDNTTIADLAKELIK